MGEQFLRRQAKGFRHRHDLARDRFAVPNLLTAMRANGTAVDCKCRIVGTGRVPDVGAGVVLRIRGDAGVDVICGNCVVGAVEGMDIQTLAPAFAVGAGMLRGIIQRPPALGGLFAVRVTEGSP